MAVPNRLQALRNLRTANLDMAFASAFGTLVTGAFLVGLIKYLGGGDLWIGVLSAIPSVLGILQIPGAIWGRSKRSYKAFVLPGGLLWRLFYVPFIAIPFLPVEASVKLSLAMFCALAAAASTFIVNPIYNDWLAELVPADSRGSFFSRRNAIATTVGGTTGILGGLLLDAFQRHGYYRAGFSTIFAAASICAGLSFGYFLRMKDLERANPIRQSLGQGILAFAVPFRDNAYRPVLVFLGAATVGQGFAGSFYFAYGIESLGLPFTVLQICGACQALGTVLSARFWGFGSDKYGNKPMLAIAGLALAINPIPWMLCRPHELVFNTILLLNAHVFFGIMWGGVNLCQFNIMLSTAKPEDRANYLGAGMALTALIGGLSPMVGATMMATLRLHNTPFHAYQVLFFTTILLRGAGMLFLARVREAGSTEVRTALQHLSEATPTRVRALRRLSRSTSAEVRGEALERLGDEGFAMAGDEMVKALYDPLPKVRRQAAQALAQLRDPASQHQAATALIEQLSQHPDLVEEETIEALGAMRDARAVELLSSLLKSPRTLVRRAAAKALGSMEGSAAVPPLIEAAGIADDPDLRRAAVQALRRLEAREAAPTLAAATLDSRASVRVAAAEAVAEMEIAEAAPMLREALARYPDAATSAIVYALGVVGELADLPQILNALAASDTPLTRRQGLLGVAHLLGVERQTYRLMLLEGMARDAALIELLKPATRKAKRIQAALQQYSEGNEAEGVRTLASAVANAGLAELAKHQIPEAFLVAAAVAGKA
ncbi:MAG: MFS transporter [Fimbriimonadaceae bacterium]